jgi:hypothetical protein
MLQVPLLELRLGSVLVIRAVDHMKILVGGRIIEGVIREKEQVIKSLGKKLKGD